jgi:tetratricopeptide (TPR) repeat protein
MRRLERLSNNFIKDNLGEHYEVLAEHYFLSENYLKSAQYSRLASRKAEKTASYNDAIAHSKKRIASLERLPQTEDIERQIIDARAILGLYITGINHFFEIKEAIEPIISLAIKYNYKRRLCQISIALATYYLFVEENPTEAFEHLEKALKISEEIRDYGISLFYARYWFGVALGLACEFERSAKYLQLANDINWAAKSLWGIATTMSSLAFFSYYYNGKINLQFNTTKEALRLAEESGDIYSKSLCYVIHGVSCFAKGLLEEGERYLLKGLELCERINFLAWVTIAQFHLGEIYYEVGNFQTSKEHYKKGVWTFESGRVFPSWVGFGKAGVARAKVMNKEKDVNLKSLYILSRDNKIKVNEGWIQRYIGEILLNIDDQHISEAEHWIQKTIESDQKNRMMFHLGKDYALYAEFFKRKGDRLKAQENLGKAIEILKECGADGWVEKYEKELAGIS